VADVTLLASLPLEDWQNAAQFNSPDSVRQALLLGLGAAMLVIGLVTMRLMLPTAADDSSGKAKATPCRRV
jgi:hypothetical protein